MIGTPAALRVIDGFECLRHNAVVGRHYQHHNVGHFRAAGAHARKRLVSRRIDEDDFAAVLFDVIRADVLRDSAGFAVRPRVFRESRRAAKFYRDRRGP